MSLPYWHSLQFLHMQGRNSSTVVVQYVRLWQEWICAGQWSLCYTHTAGSTKTQVICVCHEVKKICDKYLDSRTSRILPWLAGQGKLGHHVICLFQTCKTCLPSPIWASKERMKICVKSHSIYSHFEKHILKIVCNTKLTVDHWKHL